MKDALPLVSTNRVEHLARVGIDLRSWYDDAMREIAFICNRERWDATRFTGLLAVLSPKVSVRRNARMAIAYAGENGRFFNDCVKSIRVSVAHYESTREIRGPKTFAFNAALCGDASSITLDTWMAKALLKDVDNANSSHIHGRKATREACFAMVRKVAKRVGLSPRDTQACIWGGAFREIGEREPGPFPILVEYERWLAYDRRWPESVTDDYIEAPTTIDMSEF